MTRTAAAWFSFLAVIVIAAIGVATVALVLGAKATDEKADETAVAEQNEQTAAAIDELSGEIEELRSTVEGLAADQAGLEGRVGDLETTIPQIEATQSELQQLKEQLGVP